MYNQMDKSTPEKQKKAQLAFFITINYLLYTYKTS